MTPARPGQVALILRVVDLPILRKIRRQTKGEICVGSIGKANVRRATLHVFNRALRKRLPSGELKEPCTVTHPHLLHHIWRPGASVIHPYCRSFAGTATKAPLEIVPAPSCVLLFWKIKRKKKRSFVVICQSARATACLSSKLLPTTRFTNAKGTLTKLVPLETVTF